MKFQIDFDILKGLNVLSAKKDVRYYMMGVNVEITPNGAYFVATDGHKMGIWHDDKITAPETISHVIPNELIEQGSKFIKGNEIFVDITLDAMIEIKHGGLILNKPAIDGKYPDFRRVIPETLSHEIAQFDPEFLSQFKKCASILNNAKSCDIAIGHNGTGGAIVDIQNGKFLGIIMPYKSKADFSSYKKPLWVEYAPAPAAIEAPAPELQAA